MKPLVSQLWPQFMADPDFAACFGQVIVEHARMLRQDRQVEFTLRSAAPLDQNLCARLLASLQPDYEGFELKIKNLFGYTMLDEHALRTLLEDMKRDGVPINGFLDRSSITITGQNITVGVCHGTKFLQEMGFEELHAKRIAEHTGVTPKVTLQSAVTAAEQQQMEEKLERKIAPPVVKFEKKNTAPSIKVEGLNLTDKPVTIFHGKMFTPKNLTPLKDLGGEGGKCMIWGDVFFTEVKGNYRKIYTVSITDYTGSINLKVRAQEGEDCSKWEGIGKGSTVIVRGDCSYDKYERQGVSASEMEKVRKSAREKLDSVSGKLTLNNNAAKTSGRNYTAKDFHIGDRVKVLSMNLEGTVHSLPDSKGNLSVTMGILNSQVNIKDVIILEDNNKASVKKGMGGSGAIKASKTFTLSSEINLIGMTVDEAIAHLDKYLDDAYLSHIPSVRIVHGKGSGALRNAVQNHLKRQKYIKSYRLGTFGEGDAGVTIAEFK